MGDGANDQEALMEADVGFLIGKSSSVSAGFSSEDDDLWKVALLTI